MTRCFEAAAKHTLAASGALNMCKSNSVSSVILFLGIICVVQQVVAQASRSNPLSPEEVNQLQTKAQAGDPTAQLNLGNAYERGNGVPQSDTQAVKWYRDAAEHGNATAQNSLGIMFRSGRGVDQDKVEAVRWYRKAAKQEYASALFNLGTAYYNGDGVGIDDTAAYAWFLLAQAFGDQSAAAAVKRMKEEAVNLQPQAFELIGDMYQKGDDLPRSPSGAINWYRKAAENGGPAVQVKLASLLLQGQSGTSNFAEVHRLCEKAANLHSPQGAYCMGQVYEQGIGVERDLPKASKWFTEAANSGLAAATLRLGKMYWKGEGVKQDKIAAYEFIYLASTSGLPEAKQERERVERELTPKELEKGRAKASEWIGQHRLLVLKSKPLASD
ncbi:MAG: SEL1-like repeat protein [Terriglobales bacterium]